MRRRAVIVIIYDAWGVPHVVRSTAPFVELWR